MRADLKWKLLGVVALTVLCGVSIWYKGIRLGLDLKGGIHLALRVEAQDAVKAVLDNRASTLDAALRKRGLRLDASVISEPDTHSVLVPRIDAVTLDDVTRVAAEYLDTARMVTLAVGDHDRIASTFSTLNLGEPFVMSA